MDNKEKQGTSDDIRIDIHEEYEMTYWTKKFGVSREELKAAVKEVGPLVLKVQIYLRSKK